MATIRTEDDSDEAPRAYHFPNTGVSGYGTRPGATPPPAPVFSWGQGAAPLEKNEGDTPSTPYRFDQNAFNNAFGQQTQGKSGTLKEWQQSIFPSLQSMFPDIQSFGSKGDKIRLPNGQVIDAVISAGAGGRGYALQYDSPTSGYFDDPLLQGYLNFGQGAIDKLMGPQSINPVLQQAIDALTKMMSQGAPHMDMSYLQPLQAAVQKRQGQIDQPGFSAAQQDLMRTNVTDPIEAQRTAAKQQAAQRLASRNIQPGSGIYEQAMLDVDRSFSQMRTTGERDLATKEIAMDEARQQEAVQMNQILAQLGLTGASAELQGQISGRGQSMGAASQLAGIGGELQNEPLRNLMSAMGIYGNMAQLPFQANANAIASMNAIGGQQVPESQGSAGLIQLLMQLAGGGEGAYQGEAGNTDAFMGALGESMPELLASFAELFKKKPSGTTSSYGDLP